MAGDDLPDALERLGGRFDFGEYEARAYLAVLRHGQLTASEVAERADVPQPRVYDTVRSLSDNGLVELQESRPMRVLAVDPRETFGEIRDSLDDLVDDLAGEFSTPTRGEGAVALVKSRATIVRHLEAVVESAEYELLLSLPPDLLGRFEDALVEGRAGGVAVDLLLSPASAAPDPDEYDYPGVASAVRARRGVTTPVVAVADGRHALYATQEALREGNDRYGVVFNRSALGFLVSGFFNTVLWTTAEDVATDGDEGRFPRRYATIRRCVTDLQPVEGDLYASVEGREVETGEHRVVEGSIVSVAFGANRETATLIVQTDDGVVHVGGQMAALEDVEAHEIVVGTDGPPGLD